MAKAEKVLIEGKFLKDFFKDEFIDKMNKLGAETFPISIILLRERKRNGKKEAYPIILNHQNKDEVQNGKLHVESPDTDLVDRFSKMIEETQK